MLERINGVAVWQSPSISVPFPTQTVQLVANTTEYRYWEVIYFYATTSRYTLTTGKLPTACRDAVMHISFGAMFTRTAVLGEDSILFSQCTERGEFYADGIVSNNYLIPYIVKFYK